MSTITSTLPTASTTSTSSTGTSTAGYNLTPSDFINMMVTQLQNQDPLNPTSDSDLLAQMSSIGQLQASDTMQTNLQAMTLQTTLGAAGNLIGKSVAGLDINQNNTTGIVTSVQVQNSNVYLQLDSGDSMALSNVTSISNAPNSSATGTAAATGAATTPTTLASSGTNTTASAAQTDLGSALAAAANAQTASLAATMGADVASQNTSSLIASLAAA